MTSESVLLETCKNIEKYLHNTVHHKTKWKNMKMMRRCSRCAFGLNESKRSGRRIDEDELIDLCYVVPLIRRCEFSVFSLSVTQHKTVDDNKYLLMRTVRNAVELMDLCRNCQRTQTSQIVWNIRYSII